MKKARPHEDPKCRCKACADWERDKTSVCRCGHGADAHMKGHMTICMRQGCPCMEFKP